LTILTLSSPLKKPPGEGTGPTMLADFRGNLVGRVPSRGERDVLQQAARAKVFDSPLPVLFALLGCLTGCTHISLRNNTGHSTATLMDIHFKQVLSVVDPKACYVGRHGDTFVWVTAAGMNGLAVFAMGALDLATGKLHTPQQTVVRNTKARLPPQTWLRLKPLRPSTMRKL